MMDLTKAKKMLKRWVEESDSYKQEKLLGDWEYYQGLYEFYKDEAPDLDEWRSRLFLGLAFGMINQDASGSLSGLITPNDFYSIYPYKQNKSSALEKATGKGKDLVMTAAALEAVMKIQENEARFYSVTFESILSSCIKSVGITKIDWVQKEEKKEYLDVEQGKIIPIEKVYKVKTPRFQSILPEDFIIDPCAKGMHDAQYAGNWYDEKTDNIKDNPYYNMTAEINAFLSSYKDKGVEVPEVVRIAEVWTKSKVYCMTGTGHVIKCHVTPYKHNEIPYAICVKHPIQGKWHGLSTMAAFADIQEMYNAIVNDHIDSFRLSMFRSFLVGAGFESKTPIRLAPGEMYTVKNVEQLKEFGTTPPPAESYRFYGQMESFTNQILGNLNQVDAENVSTATEAKLVYARASSQYRDFINYNRENYIRRLVKLWIELNQQFLTKDDFAGIVPESTLEKVMFEPDKVDLGASFGFYVTGEKNLEDRQTQLEKIGILTDSLLKVQGLPPEIDRRKFVERIIKTMDMGDELMINEQELEQPKEQGQGIAAGDTLSKDLAALAQSQGMSPEQLLSKLAEKVGSNPQTILKDMSQAGGVNQYLQKVAQTLPTPPEIPNGAQI